VRSCCGPGNVTFVIDNLERRERVENDGRKFLIQLTKTGRELIERVFPQHLQEITREFSRLGPAERETLRRLCRKLGRDCEKSRRSKIRCAETEWAAREF